MLKELPPPDLVRKLLRYDADTGKLYWRVRSPDLLGDSPPYLKTWNRRFANSEAFVTRHNTGHLRGWLLEHNVAAQRVVWAICYGKWPDGMVKHINGDCTDNRIENLTTTNPMDARRNVGTFATKREAADAWVSADGGAGCQITVNDEGGYDVFVCVNLYISAP